MAAHAWSADVERIRSGLAPSRPTLLLLATDAGQECVRYAALLQRVAQPQANVLIATPSGQDLLLQGRTGPPATVPLQQADAAARALSGLRVTRVNVLAWSDVQDEVVQLIDLLRAPYDVTFLDTPASGAPPPYLWLADRWIAATRDVAKRMTALAALMRVRPALITEPYPPHRFEVSLAPFRPDEPLRVLVPNAPSVQVPGPLLNEVAALIRARDLPIRLFLLPAERPGRSLCLFDDRALVLGLWGRDDLSSLVCGLRPQLAWFPYLSGSTGHNFVLSDIMNQGLPVLASAIGSFPERLEGRAQSWLLPATTDAAGWLDRMLHLRAGGMSEPADAGAEPDTPPFAPDFYPHEYLAPLREAASSLG